MSVGQTASDGAERVQVTVDATDLRVRVVVLPGWRRSGGAESLGTSVLGAYTAATASAVTEQTHEQPVVAAAAEARRRSVGWATTPRALLHRAFRDLDELRGQLKDLRTTGTTITEPGHAVTVTLHGAQLVAVHIDPHWLSSAHDAEVELRLATILTTAARAGRTKLDQALDGCPDLRAVLAVASAAAPRWGLN